MVPPRTRTGGERCSYRSQSSLSGPTGSGVGGDELVEVSRRSAVDTGERILDETRDLEESDPPLEECGDGDLVRGVEGARVGAASLAGLAREAEEREATRVGRLELERQPGAESSPGTGVAARSGT